MQSWSDWIYWVVFVCLNKLFTNFDVWYLASLTYHFHFNSSKNLIKLWLHSSYIYFYRRWCQCQGPEFVNSFTQSSCVTKWSMFPIHVDLFCSILLYGKGAITRLCCLNLSIIYLFFFQQRAVELLLKHKAEVNAKDKFWHTPLHMAAAKWATGCALVLIPHVCSLDVADKSGRTPLHHAAYSGHEEVSVNHYSF